jgi:hypothetical protein
MIRLLVNSLGILDGFEFEYEREFDKDFPVGDTVRIKEPWRAIVQDGLGWNPQSIARRNRTVSMDQVFSTQFLYDSIEKALQMERTKDDIQDNIIQPAMKQMAQEADSRAALFAYLNTSTTVGSLGTTPTSLDTYNGPRTRIFELAGWDTRKRSMIITPQMGETAITGTVRALFNPPDAVSKAFKEGRLGFYAGFDWTESMSLYTHTAGTIAGTYTVNGANQSGSLLNVNCTNGDTWKRGDHLSIANVNSVNSMTRRSINRVRHFVITQDVTAVGVTATLPILPPIIGPGSPYQNVDALPANGATITHMPGTTSPNGKSGPFGLAFTKNAFACVGGKLPMPKKGTKELAEEYTDPRTGITISFIVDFATRERQFENRMDTLMGFGLMWAEFCAVRIGSAQ